MTSYWADWATKTDEKGTLTIGWRSYGDEDILPFKKCEIADLITPGIAYAFCLKVNTASNRFVDFTVETSCYGDLPARVQGNLFYPSDSRGSLTPIPTSEHAWVLPMSTEIENVHLWIYVLAVFHGDHNLARSLIPIIKVLILFFKL